MIRSILSPNTFHASRIHPRDFRYIEYRSSEMEKHNSGPREKRIHDLLIIII